MRLQKYIVENRSVEISQKVAANILSTYCDRALSSNYSIFRGNMELNKDFYIIDASTYTERESPYASNNFYNLILSNLPNWRNYPKRNKSIIGTTSFRTSTIYSNEEPYLLLPYNGAKIGVCPEPDIWESFASFEHKENLDCLNKYLSEMFVNLLDEYPSTYKNIESCCNKIDLMMNDKDLGVEYIEDIIDNNIIRFFTYTVEYLGGSKKLIDCISDTLDPEYNGFKLIEIGRGSININNEIWTDSKCLMVLAKRSVFNSIGIDNEYLEDIV